ncbi:hypothetical protein RS030_7979 [Cryptosporidium xiaoi]|uniref:Uncharacterized protein n=1 Tax=Cryptosporidium xiaoi TaxID=659607 RepID=A0AAV9XTL5_9CRYT
MNIYTLFCAMALFSGSIGTVSLIMGSLYFSNVLILELPSGYRSMDSIALILTGIAYFGLFIYSVLQILKERLWVTKQFPSVEMRPLLKN